MSFNHILKYDDGSLKTEMTITDDKAEGQCNNYWPNGNLQYTAVYVGGAVDGDMTQFLEDGTVLKVRTYDMGELTHVDGEPFVEPEGMEAP
jgi:antitoxin component YwqK of YwqJK toxin-antitoxin module